MVGGALACRKEGLVKVNAIGEVNGGHEWVLVK